MGSEPSLYFGDVDVDGWVEQLQLRLDEQGYSLGPRDGWFGTNTHRAVEHFQRDHADEPHQLKADGVVGNATWAALTGRDPEPGGVNNGPNGDTRPHGHHGGGGATGPDVNFDGPPDVVAGGVTIGVQITGTTDVVLTAYAEHDGQTLAQSQAVAVSSNGPQTLPMDQPDADAFTITVWATIDGGASHAVSESTTIQRSGGG